MSGHSCTQNLKNHLLLIDGLTLSESIPGLKGGFREHHSPWACSTIGCRWFESLVTALRGSGSVSPTPVLMRFSEIVSNLHVSRTCRRQVWALPATPHAIFSPPHK